ncbi:MAG TPA: BamA/TamA family outer membrane protein [Fulvivirga sp.]|nr:BamA/TamA family outer membrane protein [Fulvivirga sp.]
MLAILISVLAIILPVEKSDSSSIHRSKVEQNQSVDDSYVTIDAIFIVGNKRTKPSIILREMSVMKGDTYTESSLADILVLDKNKLLSTRLFVTVDISILHLSDTQVDIVVNVSERWYTFPSPIFDLVDRNFNDWWQNQNRDLSRTNFGVKIYQNNFRGRNETLKLLLQLGYTHQFGVTYRIPYIDKKQRHGLTFHYNYAENKNIAVRTIDHKPVFFDSEEILKVTRDYGLGYHFRKSFYNIHSLDVRLNDNTINDTISNINQEYYKNTSTKQKYIQITYSFTHDKRDNSSYPISGNRFDFEIQKLGVGIFNDVDKTEISISYAKFIDLKKGFLFANYSSIYVSEPEQQPYANIGALGFKKNFVRGYELYLIEGKSFSLNRSTIKKRIFSTVGRLGFIPIKQFRKIPIDIYLKTYYDMGYVENFENYNQNKRLSDRFLFGAGGGIDFVTYYDTVIRVEYSINREQESGFFLHFRKEF